MAKNIVKTNIDNVEYTTRPFGTCYTSGYDAVKEVNCPGFSLVEGATILIEFSERMATDIVYLSIEGSAPLPVVYGNDQLTHKDGWGDNQICEFYYDGSDWIYLKANDRNIKYAFKATELGAMMDVNTDIDLIPLSNGDAAYDSEMCAHDFRNGFQYGDIISVYFDSPLNYDEWMNIGVAMAQETLDTHQLESGMTYFAFYDLTNYSPYAAVPVWVNFSADYPISIGEASRIQSEYTGSWCPILNIGSTYLFQYINDSFLLMGYNPGGIVSQFDVVIDQSQSSGSNVSVSQSYTDSTYRQEIAKITIDGTTKSIYAPKGTVTNVTPGIGLTGTGSVDSAITSSGTINLKPASPGEIGGVKVSSVKSSSVTVNTASTTAGKYYPLELNADGLAIVNVPWTPHSLATHTKEGLVKLYREKGTSAVSCADIPPINNTKYAVDMDSEGVLYINIPTVIQTAATTSNAGLMTSSDKAKLDSLTNYTLPLAANGTRGGIQVGYATTGKNYAVQLSSEKAYVNVPWTDTKVTQTLAASGYSNWRSLLVGASNGSSSDFTVSTMTDSVYAASAVKIQPSTGNIITSGTITASSFSGTATKATQDSAGNTITSTYLKLSGGTLTGTLTCRALAASTGATYDIGSSSTRFKNGYFSTSVYAASGFYESSDERLKDFEKGIDINLDSLSKLKKNYFTWKHDDDKKRQIGISAQEIQELYPEIVQEQEDGTLVVAYDKLSVIALAAVDKLHEENKELKARLDKLEKLLK